MISISPGLAPESPPAPELHPDYWSRALALWPRLERHKLARVRHNPNRVAALISRRTNLSHAAILDLLGAPAPACEAPSRDN